MKKPKKTTLGFEYVEELEQPTTEYGMIYDIVSEII